MSRATFSVDAVGRVAPAHQTRAGSFLISAHGAVTRQLLATVPGPVQNPAQAELHAQFCRETEIVSLLSRAVSWTFDPYLSMFWAQWETAWLPRPALGAPDLITAALVDLAAFGHALHAAIRPAAALPAEAKQDDPFAVALTRIEAESSRLMQAQIIFLKGPSLNASRDVVTAAVEFRHNQVSSLWTEMMERLA